MDIQSIEGLNVNDINALYETVVETINVTEDDLLSLGCVSPSHTFQCKCRNGFVGYGASMLCSGTMCYYSWCRNNMHGGGYQGAYHCVRCM